MLETKRLKLRKFNENDIDDFYKVFSKKEVVKYLPFEPLSKKEAVEKLDNIINNLSEVKKGRPKFILAIQLKENQKVIGWLGSGPIPFDKKKIELFYALDSTYWKKGLAREAAFCLLNFLLNEMGLKRIYALVDENNTGSVKLLKYLDFSFKKRVEINKDKHQFFDGLDLYVN